MITWNYNINTKILVHHIGIFYQIIETQNNLKKNILLDNQNDDSLGADFYEIKKLKKKKLSAITILELEKLGYQLN